MSLQKVMMSKRVGKRVSLSGVVLFFLIALNVHSAEILGVYFSPDKSADKPIVQLYDNAEEYIYLAI